MSASAPRPLEGLLIISIEQALAAPLCSGRLAEMGARVVKVERAEGDFARGYDAAAKGQSSYFAWTNRGKESLVLDFKDADDAALLRRLIAKADILIQNLAPGALERAGFGSEQLRADHPRLITCDITGYGAEGPAAGLKAYDLLVQCESGLAGLTGTPEACGRVGVSICDIGAGLNATIGALSALTLRQHTGQGSSIAVSLFDAAADWMTVPYLHELYGAGAPPRLGLRHPSIAPYGAYAAADGAEVVISIQNEREWRQFCCDVLQQPALTQDQRFASNNARVAHRDALDAAIAAVFSTLPLDRLLARLTEASIAFGQLRSVAEMARHPALRTWPMQSVEGELAMVAPPVRTPWDAGRFEPAPSLGAQSEMLRREFATELETL